MRRRKFLRNVNISNELVFFSKDVVVCVQTNFHYALTRVIQFVCCASVDIGFLGATISHVTLSCSQYLYSIPRFVNWVIKSNIHLSCWRDIK